MAPRLPEDWVETNGQLADLAGHLRASGRFAFDTEFVSESTFEPILCLIQVATAERLAVVDPLALDDLAPFWDVVLDPNVEVVMHASGEDMRIVHLRTGELPARVVDAQLAAGLAGFSYPLSLNNLVQQALGVTLLGGETRTDWRRRPLAPAQLRYALDDVRYLLDLADVVTARLHALGRIDWVEQEYRGLIGQVAAREDAERWRRLPGLHHLNRRGLEIARRLAEWRREQARRANRPIRHLLKDELLVAIAKRQPSSRGDLEALRDFNRNALIGHADAILRAIADARAVPTDELPEPAERFEDGPGLTMVINLLNAALTQQARRQQIAPGLLGTVADLKDLTRWHLAERPEGDRPELVRGWRGEVCGEVLLDVLSGRRSLRIVDPTAEVPVALDPIPDDAPGVRT